MSVRSISETAFGSAVTSRARAGTVTLPVTMPFLPGVSRPTSKRCRRLGAARHAGPMWPQVALLPVMPSVTNSMGLPGSSGARTGLRATDQRPCSNPLCVGSAPPSRRPVTFLPPSVAVYVPLSVKGCFTSPLGLKAPLNSTVAFMGCPSAGTQRSGPIVILSVPLTFSPSSVTSASSTKCIDVLNRLAVASARVHWPPLNVG